jgi:hypothetical protein
MKDWDKEESDDDDASDDDDDPDLSDSDWELNKLW